MRTLVAGYYEFLKNIKDIKMIVILILFPIVITYILGNAVGGFFELDASKRIAVGYVNRDTGIVGKGFDKFLENKEIKARLKVVSYKDVQLGRDAAERGTVDSLIYLPDNLSDSIAKGKSASMELYGKKNVEFIESLMGGFISSSNSFAAIGIAGGSAMISLENSTDLKRIYYGKTSKKPRMIDYYTVLTLFQMLIMGALFGIGIMRRNEESDMHIRIHSLPIRQENIILGRVIGSVIYLFLAAVVILLVDKYGFNANLDGNMFIILGTLLVFSIIAVGIGIIVGSLVKSFSTSAMIVFLIMMFFGVVSGAISPASTNDTFSVFSPNYHAKILVFGTVFGYSRAIMEEAALWLLGFVTVIYGVSAILIRRAKYDNI